MKKRKQTLFDEGVASLAGRRHVFWFWCGLNGRTRAMPRPRQSRTWWAALSPRQNGTCHGNGYVSREQGDSDQALPYPTRIRLRRKCSAPEYHVDMADSSLPLTFESDGEMPEAVRGDEVAVEHTVFALLHEELLFELSAVAAEECSRRPIASRPVTVPRALCTAVQLRAHIEKYATPEYGFVCSGSNIRALSDSDSFPFSLDGKRTDICEQGERVHQRLSTGTPRREHLFANFISRELVM